ncbi:hypothetical protein [Methanoregula sp.]|jgi:hypothetical protein|uniref:hypothetical protein n=1 Tax=Methanoregula sp. TaxID=2052170 RepID=UPI003C297BD0
MTYYIYDVNGYVGDLASSRGLYGLKEALQGRGGALEELFENGCIEDINGVIAELKGAKNKNTDVAKTICNLRALVKRCDSIIIITDGVGLDDGTPETTDAEIEAHLMRIPAYAANPEKYRVMEREMRKNPANKKK